MVLRKAEVRLSVADAREWFDTVLAPLVAVHPSKDLYRRSLDLQARYGYGLYDCLIIAAALEAGCKRLLSEDLQHGQRIEGLRIENPFKA
jgi:predicted nucleic acid-binding protein